MNSHAVTKLRQGIFQIKKLKSRKGHCYYVTTSISLQAIASSTENALNCLNLLFCYRYNHFIPIKTV